MKIAEKKFWNCRKNGHLEKDCKGDKKEEERWRVEGEDRVREVEMFGAGREEEE